jgi:hypothetical protein
MGTSSENLARQTLEARAHFREVPAIILTEISRGTFPVVPTTGARTRIVPLRSTAFRLLGRCSPTCPGSIVPLCGVRFRSATRRVR